MKNGRKPWPYELNEGSFKDDASEFTTLIPSIYQQGNGDSMSSNGQAHGTEHTSHTHCVFLILIHTHSVFLTVTKSDLNMASHWVHTKKHQVPRRVDLHNQISENGIRSSMSLTSSPVDSDAKSDAQHPGTNAWEHQAAQLLGMRTGINCSIPHFK